MYSSQIQQGRENGNKGWKIVDLQVKIG